MARIESPSDDKDNLIIVVLSLIFLITISLAALLSIVCCLMLIF